MSRTPVRAVFVVGTRPEAIKMLPVIMALRSSRFFEPIVISTGQQAQLVREVLQIGGVSPDVEFTLPQASTPTDHFAPVMAQLNSWFLEQFGTPQLPEQAPYAEGYPAACFVQGDTTSAAAAALAAFHLRLPVVHVEAGLRTGDALSPFPEELHRQLISRIAALHLAPTNDNKANLLREDIDFDRIFVTGNTSIDTLHVAAVSAGRQGINAELAPSDPLGQLVVVTAHGRQDQGPQENGPQEPGAPLERIAEAVAQLADAHPRATFAVVLHPTEEASAPLRSRLSDVDNVLLAEPMGYVEFAGLLGRADFALTDSGGVQEEAPALGTPVLCVADSTERREGMEAGTVQLVGTRTEDIVAAASVLLQDPEELERRRALQNPYGDGHAAERILALLAHIVFDAPQPESFGAGVDRLSILRRGGSADPVASGWTPAWTPLDLG